MSYALKANLRGQCATPELQRLLPKAELSLASESPHLPNLVALVGLWSSRGIGHLNSNSLAQGRSVVFELSGCDSHSSDGPADPSII